MEQLGSLVRTMDFVPKAGTFDTGSSVHGISKELEPRLVPTEDSSGNRSRMKTYTDSKVASIRSKQNFQLSDKCVELSQALPGELAHNLCMIL
jgi:hypothetical protein